MMERVMERLNRVREFLQQNLYLLLAVICIVILAIGYVIFYVSSIDPAFQARNRVAPQLDESRNLLISARQQQAESPESLKTRVALAQATLATAMEAFLTGDQSTQTLDALYQYARESGVKIVDLQVPPTPTPLPTATWTPTRLPTPLPSPTSLTRSAVTPSGPTQPTAAQPIPPTATRVPPTPLPRDSAYYVRAIRLRAQGTSRQLVDFAARFKEANLKGVVVNSFAIEGSEGTTIATLNMDLSLFVLQSPASAPATRVPTSAPVSAPAPMPIVATPMVPSVAPSPTWAPVVVTLTPIPTFTLIPTQTPQYRIHIVQPGDTLFSLARRYGTSVDAIVALNHLPNYNIRVGQQLLIPAP